MVIYVGEGEPEATMRLLWGQVPATVPRRGPKSALSVDEVVAAALALADEGGIDAVSIVTATSGRARSAAILRAPANVPKTISSPVQWKSIGNTRGVPSAAV